jgi:hypothetical protein
MDPSRLIAFDPKTHRYWKGDPENPFEQKEELVSVSRVLSSCDVYGYPKTTKNVVAMNKGTAIHYMTTLVDEGLLSSGEVLEEAHTGHIIAYESFCKDYSFVPEFTEKPMYHSKYLYAGTPDKYGITIIGDAGLRTLIELKTGMPNPGYFLQVSAYKEILLDNEYPVDRILILYTSNDGRYTISEPPSPEIDFKVFLSCLNVWRWKARNRVKNNGEC